MVCKLLAFADDIAILGNNLEEIEECMTRIEEKARKVGLKVNQEKTKYMIVRKDISTPITPHIRINNKEYETVENFKYLGVLINENNQIEPELNARLNSANRSFFSMNNILKSTSVSRNTKIRI